MLSVCISSWRVCAVHTSVPYAYAQHVLKGPFQICKFTLMLSIRLRNWCIYSGYASVPHAYDQHVLKGLRSVHTLVPDMYVRSVHAPVPDSYDQRMHQFLKHMLRVYKMNKVPKTLSTLTNGIKCSTIFFGPKLKKILLKIRLIIRIRSFAVLNEPVNILNFLNPQVASP